MTKTATISPYVFCREPAGPTHRLRVTSAEFGKQIAGHGQKREYFWPRAMQKTLISNLWQDRLQLYEVGLLLCANIGQFTKQPVHQSETWLIGAADGGSPLVRPSGLGKNIWPSAFGPLLFFGLPVQIRDC